MKESEILQKFIFLSNQSKREIMHTLYRVKSFSENPNEGNLAGVVTNAEHLSDVEMQNIAKEVGASETVFILPSKNADVRIRWFTPNTEVGICIHATIAALGVLQNINYFNNSIIRIETKNTKLLCKINGNQIFVNVPGFSRISNVPNISQMLTLLPIKNDQIISNPGIIKIFDDYELIIEVKSLEDLRNLNPNQQKYSEICSTLNVTGISIFTRETFNPDNHIHTREFAPLYGYLEDPLCGMAAGAIATYLNTAKNLRIEQGYFCETNGVILIEHGIRDSLWIGGSYSILS